MRSIVPHMLVLSIVLLNGCAPDPTTAISQSQAAAQVATPFAQGAITLDIQSDPDLNTLHNIANSCTLLVIQSKKTSTLNKLLDNPPKLKQLFNDAGAEDDILKVDRYSAMPGQRTTLHIDRSENTRYVAIVAGYYPFPQRQHMIIVAVPMTSESHGWWNKTWLAQLIPLSLKIRLSRNSITQFDGAKPEPQDLSAREVLPDTPASS